MNEALSSQRSAGPWPFATLDGVCKTKTLEGQLTEGSTERPDDENVCDYFLSDYNEKFGCPGTPFCEKGNISSQFYTFFV